MHDDQPLPLTREVTERFTRVSVAYDRSAWHLQLELGPVGTVALPTPCHAFHAQP